MITFLIIFFLYVLPLWFMFRLWYFSKDRGEYSGYFDGADKFFSVFIIVFISWIGFIVACNVVEPNKVDLYKTFFMRYGKDKSMRARIFWYKVRVVLLRLLFIKESK